MKLIDACYSGTLLVKGEWFPQNKDGFKNLISIASCLDTQTSLTGNPLSLFTEKFRAAALRKTEGPVFYTDIINTLRDEFIDNNSQTPFFVSQHTAREQFVDDASRLAALRKTLAEITTAATNRVQIAQEIVPATMTLLERLAAADAKVVKPDLMANFVGTFFDNLIKRVSTSEFAEFFDLEVTEHARTAISAIGCDLPAVRCSNHTDARATAFTTTGSGVLSSWPSKTSLPDPPPGATGTVASSKMVLSWPLSWDCSTKVSVKIASNGARLMEIFRLLELTVTRARRPATFCAHGCGGRQRIGELACDSKAAANLRRPTSRFAKQVRYLCFVRQKALQFRQH